MADRERVWQISESVGRVLETGASIAALVALIPVLTDINNFTGWKFWFVAIGGAVFVVVGIIRVFGPRSRKSYKRKNTDGIRTYMHSWIKDGKRVAIWTRDMSWANNDETRALLTLKARNDELIVCAPAPTPLLDALVRDGAEANYYTDDKKKYTPASRFTIINYGLPGARVAVGHLEGDRHIITEFSQGEHPAFYMAEDLVKLAREKSDA
jgi:hypothetical protein